MLHARMNGKCWKWNHLTTNLGMIFHKGMGWKRDFISQETLQVISDLGVKIFSIWGDIQIPEQRRLLIRISKFVDLNIVTASHSAARRIPRHIPVLYSWVPVTSDSGTPGDCLCGQFVSFAGSLKSNRKQIINYRQEEKILQINPFQQK
jgi:hypothetical protein